MCCYLFKGDDIFIGNERAILAVGGQRYLIDKLTRDELSWLHNLRDAKMIIVEDETKVRLLKILLDTGGLMKKGTVVENKHRCSYAIARSKTMTSISRNLSILGSPLGLVFMAASLPLTAILFFTVPDLPSLSIIDILLAVPLYILSVLFHELGHGANCFRLTGMVGGLRWNEKSVLSFSVLTDVSALSLVGARDRAVNAIAGVCFQMFFASVVILGMTLELLPLQIAMLTVYLIGFSICFNLLPHFQSDGYYFLSDLFSLVMHTKNVHSDKIESSRWGYIVKVLTKLRLVFYIAGLFAIFRLSRFC